MVDDAEYETYPPAPSRGGNANAPMPDDEYESDSSTDAELEPVDTESATSEQAIEGEEAQDEEGNVPFNKHPRWQERELEWKEKLAKIEREAEESRQLARAAIERIQGPSQPVVPQADPWEGLVNHPDPATAQWYQELRNRTEKTVDTIVERKLSNVMQAVDAGRTELAAIKIAEFRRENPDIKQGSQEEAAIASFVSQGFDLNTAKKLALFDKLEQENRELKGKRSATPRKVAANNTERSSGIPANSGLPNRKSSWKDAASDAYDKSGGDPVSVFNSVFRGRKR